MAKRWSKLQTLVQDLFEPSLHLQLHCSIYRMKSQHGSTDLPRYWMTIGKGKDKQIIFDYPGKIAARPGYPSKYSWENRDTGEMMGSGVSEIGVTLKQYCDTPKTKLLTADIPDEFGILEIIRAADRRIGLERLHKWAKGKSIEARMIVAMRETK